MYKKKNPEYAFKKPTTLKISDKEKELIKKHYPSVQAFFDAMVGQVFAPKGVKQ